MSTLEPHPDVAAQRLGETTVLVHTQTNRVYELNQTGARFWELLCEGCDRSEIQRRLLQEFDVTRAQLDKEIEDISTLLTTERLLIERPAE